MLRNLLLQLSDKVQLDVRCQLSVVGRSSICDGLETIVRVSSYFYKLESDQGRTPPTKA